LNDRPLVPEPSHRQTDLSFEVSQIATAEIAELNVFEVVPDALVSVQIWRIPGELLQMQALSSAISQELFDGLIAMDGRAVPDHEELAGEMAQQMTEEAHHILAMEGLLPGHVEELAIVGDATDRREMIPGERDVQERSLSAWGIRPHPARQEVEARFVYPDDGLSVSLGPLFSAGHRSSYQVWMASSFRWVARSIGCWGLHLMARSRRLTWA